MSSPEKSQPQSSDNSNIRGSSYQSQPHDTLAEFNFSSFCGRITQSLGHPRKSSWQSTVNAIKTHLFVNPEISLPVFEFLLQQNGNLSDSPNRFERDTTRIYSALEKLIEDSAKQGVVLPDKAVAMITHQCLDLIRLELKWINVRPNINQLPKVEASFAVDLLTCIINNQEKLGLDCDEIRFNIEQFFDLVVFDKEAFHRRLLHLAETLACTNFSDSLCEIWTKIHSNPQQSLQLSALHSEHDNNQCTLIDIEHLSEQLLRTLRACQIGNRPQRIFNEVARNRNFNHECFRQALMGLAEVSANEVEDACSLLISEILHTELQFQRDYESCKQGTADPHVLDIVTNNLAMSCGTLIDFLNLPCAFQVMSDIWTSRLNKERGRDLIRIFTILLGDDKSIEEPYTFKPSQIREYLSLIELSPRAELYAQQLLDRVFR
jgi:hypothetical protein